MSSMVEDVARAIDGCLDLEYPPSIKDVSEAAIAAATPHLRRQFRDELFAELIAWVVQHTSEEHLSVGLDWTDVESWLINWKEADDA